MIFCLQVSPLPNLEGAERAAQLPVHPDAEGVCVCDCEVVLSGQDGQL